jgi:linearmycin/streptolysin S transport system permease protein
MSQLRAALLIAGTDLHRRLRNRSFVSQAVVGPIVLAAIISLAFGGGSLVDTTIGVVDADGSDASRGLVSGLEQASSDELRFETVDSVGAARPRVADDDDLGAAIVVPAGFAASLASADPASLEVLTSSDDPISADVARSVAATVADRADAARLAVATSGVLGTPPPDADALAAIDLPVTVDVTGTGGDVSPAAYFGPAMGLLFLFLSVGVMARDLLVDERTRLIDRLRAGPVGDGAILVGKGVSVLAIGVSSLLVIWAVTSRALDADWGDPLGVLVLIVAAALAVAGIAGLIAAVARTEQQADTLATTLAFVFALVGGAFVPPGLMPAALRALSLLTPTGAALHGFAELSAGEGTLVDVVPYVLALLGWAVGAGLVAARLLPRRLSGGR